MQNFSFKGKEWKFLKYAHGLFIFLTFFLLISLPGKADVYIALTAGGEHNSNFAQTIKSKLARLGLNGINCGSNVEYNAGGGRDRCRSRLMADSKFVLVELLFKLLPDNSFNLHISVRKNGMPAIEESEIKLANTAECTALINAYTDEIINNPNNPMQWRQLVLITKINNTTQDDIPLSLRTLQIDERISKHESFLFIITTSSIDFDQIGYNAFKGKIAKSNSMYSISLMFYFKEREPAACEKRCSDRAQIREELIVFLNSQTL